MIFVTVGSMLPFDRFIKAADNWAAAHPDEEVFAQIGEGVYEPVNMPFARMLTPTIFAQKVAAATLVVAHAGMGSIIMAAEAGKPVLLFPRRASWGEHTTDHQLHTVDKFKDKVGVFVATDEAELEHKIDEARRLTLGGATLETVAPAAFVAKIRQSILN